METKFAVGETAFWATCERKQKFLTCPDCLGSGQLTITMGDKTQHSIECTGCENGDSGPSGRVYIDAFTRKILGVVITGIEIHGTRESYRSEQYIIDVNDLFKTKEEAESRAQFLAEQLGEEAMGRFNGKEKDKKSWAWNATYHRKRVKDAEKEIKYHTSKLNMAKLKSKEGR